MLKHQKLLHNLLATCKDQKNSKKIIILPLVYTNEYLTFPNIRKGPKTLITITLIFILPTHKTNHFRDNETKTERY